MHKNAPYVRPGHKYCFRCRSEKPTTDFYTDRAKPDQLTSQCKPCAKATQAQSRLTKLRVQAVVEYVTGMPSAAMIALPTAISGMLQ